MLKFSRTRRKEIRPRGQNGQAIVLIALLILVLFGMLGLAIDSGRAYVDRRDQQAAVDAAALAAGDWFENYNDLYGSTLPNAKAVYQTNLHLYAGPTSDVDITTFVGPNNNLQQDTDVLTFAGGYTLTIVATNTQFNGYQFLFTSTHQLPLAFMQLFGGSPTITINATATAIVGNQRQTPALLTLSTGSCSLNLKGAATLTLLGDAYSNGTACVDPNLQEAGNCYGAAGSNCSSASYYCYNSTPGFVPYPPNTRGTPCAAGDTQGIPVVPAPTLPDPGYLSNSLPYYSSLPLQSYNQNNRTTWTEMTPGPYGTFHLTGGSASCAFLDPGIYVWTNGYTSDATGSLLSNELKPPDEELYSAPGTTNTAGIQFWNLNGTSCAGHFTLAVNTVAGYGIKHGGLGLGNWGVELTSVRWDTFSDPTLGTCSVSPGCRRESAPSECQSISTADIRDQVIDISVTQNAPGAQYYNVYLDPNGCDGVANNFSFVNRFLAPGFTDFFGPPAFATGPYPNGGAGTVLSNGTGGYPCAAAGHTICAVSAATLLPNKLCYAQTRTVNCQPPDDEIAPQCFSSCPPPPGLLSQENAPFSLQYPPYTGGDVSNENYCQVSPNPGDPSAPCATAKVTPGGVQFYMPAGSCFTQNAQGATYIFAGLQYNWISIYSPAANTCNNTMNGGAATQFIGTIYTPGVNWTINGGDRSPLAGQLICYTASVSGGGAVGIDFNPNYSPAPPAARLIN
ncbi:MAG TPA: pilus assembly protein TadG-related protein [Candidatus Dormibacteraeota bacterium]|nr:pilus assembly protein TadG-related protein [Candidatus Dormibacteraeota bacterium]